MGFAFHPLLLYLFPAPPQARQLPVIRFTYTHMGTEGTYLTYIAIYPSWELSSGLPLALMLWPNRPATVSPMIAGQPAALANRSGKCELQ